MLMSYKKIDQETDSMNYESDFQNVKKLGPI